MPTISEALAEAAQREPDLAPYYEFHRTLLELQEKAQEEIAATLELADQQTLQARLLQGLPQISFVQLPIETERFADLAMAIAQALKDYYAPESTFPPATAGGTGGRLPAQAAEWVSLAQKQFEENQVCPEHSRGTGPETVSVSPYPLVPASSSPPVSVSPCPSVRYRVPPCPTLAEMAADMALKPYLVWAAEQMLPHLDQEQWRRGYCPVCGGTPDFAFLSGESGARYLLCARCNSQWLYRRMGCPFCGNNDYTGIVYYPSDDGVYRLYLCKACHRYLKTIDLRKTNRQKLLVEVERITTVAMDMAAQQEGYH